MKIKNIFPIDEPRFYISLRQGSPISWLVLSDELSDMLEEFDISFYHKIYCGYVKLETISIEKFFDRHIKTFFKDDSLYKMVCDVMIDSVRTFTVINSFSENYNRSMIYPNLYLSGSKENLAMMRMSW